MSHLAYANIKKQKQKCVTRPWDEKGQASEIKYFKIIEIRGFQGGPLVFVVFSREIMF